VDLVIGAVMDAVCGSIWGSGVPLRCLETGKTWIRQPPDDIPVIQMIQNRHGPGGWSRL